MKKNKRRQTRQCSKSTFNPRFKASDKTIIV